MTRKLLHSEPCHSSEDFVCTLTLSDLLHIGLEDELAKVKVISGEMAQRLAE